jgi:hypothetical protein
MAFCDVDDHPQKIGQFSATLVLNLNKKNHQSFSKFSHFLELATISSPYQHFQKLEK